MKRVVAILTILIIAFTASAKKSEYQTVLKSGDKELKYSYALQCHENKDYKKAITLLEDISLEYRGTERAQMITYYLALCYTQKKDYESGAHYAQSYIETYLRGEFLEDVNYVLAYCYYKQSPEYELDQTSTELAIEQLTKCLVLYPTNEKADDAKTMLEEMKDKLAKRELANTKLYFNLGIYRGNNYRAAIVTAQNAMNDYPDCNYIEEFAYYIVKSKYKETVYSNSKRLYERSEDAADECYYFMSEYPDSKYKKEIEKMAKHLEKINKAKLGIIEDFKK